MLLADPTIQTTYRIITNWAEKTPDATAIVSPEHSPVTYKELKNRIEITIETLNAMGIGRDDRVAIVLQNGPEMATTFLAVASGATCAPLNPQYRADEFDFFLSDLKPKALIIQAGMDSPATNIAEKRQIPIVRLSSMNEDNRQDTLALEVPHRRVPTLGGFGQPQDVALVLHTSGTTARPKIVPLTQLNICTSANNIRRTLELSPSDRCLNVMPLFHIHGLIGALLSTIYAGGSIVCTPGFLAPKFFAWLRDFQPTWYTAVPTIHQAILARER